MIGALLGKMFGTDKAAASQVDNLSSGIDKLLYTAQEQAGDRAALRAVEIAAKEKSVDQLIAWHETSKGQNLARRFLAISISGVWLSFFATAVLLKAMAPWVSPTTYPKVQESVAGLMDGAEMMGEAVWVILLFYFSMPVVGKGIDAAKTRFGNPPPAKGNTT